MDTAVLNQDQPTRLPFLVLLYSVMSFTHCVILVSLSTNMCLRRAVSHGKADLYNMCVRPSVCLLLHQKTF